MIDFTDRRLVVIGGGSGIGLAAAELFERLGGSVFVADLDPSARGRIPADAGFAVCDATDASSVEAAFASAESTLGGMDGVFITVGGSTPLTIAETDLVAWQAELRFNLDAIYLCCRAALPLITPGGALVTTSSGRAVQAVVEGVGYSVAKAGVVALNRSLAIAGAPRGIRVNCVAPGPTDTARFRALMGSEEAVEDVRRSVPLGTITKPGDVAQLAAFLLSDAARQITGQTVHINGGVVMP